MKIFRECKKEVMENPERRIASFKDVKERTPLFPDSERPSEMRPGIELPRLIKK